MEAKLEVANYNIDGRISHMKEGTEEGLFKTRTLTFSYTNKKLNCSAVVTFVTTKDDVDLYESALRFIKRLK